MGREWAARLRAMENPGAPVSPGTWAAPASAPDVRCEARATPIGGHYPERTPARRCPPGEWRRDLRDWSGIAAQAVALVALVALTAS